MRRVTLFALIGLLTACAGGSPATSLPQDQPLLHNRAVHAPGSATQDVWLYVSGLENNVVTVFDLSELGTPKIAQISQGVDAPIGLAVDLSGNLYVANTTGSVSIYASGATSPSLTLTQGLTEAVDVAVDAGGNVYVANRGGTEPDIVVYPPNSTAPSGTIAGPLIEVPNEVTFDALGDLFYSDNSTGVSERAYGTSQLVSLGLHGLTKTNGVAVDPNTGDLYVGNFGNNQDDVLDFKAGAVTSYRTLRGSKGADMLAMAADDGLEYIMVPDAYSNVVHVFPDDSDKAIATLHVKPAKYPQGVAIKAAGIP